jgi:WD40 repeat protein
VTFAPDGTLASGSWSGIVSLWNPHTGQAVAHPVLTEAAPVSSISFDPTGDTFATVGGSSGTPRLWTTSTLQQFGSDLPGGQGRWGNAAFTPDGRSLLVVFDDGTADRWPVTVAAWEQQACKVAGRSLTSEEWARFVRGHTYSTTCQAG